MSAIYNQIGTGYDTTRSADPEILNILAGLLSLKENGLYLDAGCGTGNYTHELAKLKGTWKAFDQSELMIEKAKQKNSNIEWSVFDVVKTHYKTASFDSILCTLAIHHFPDLTTAFKEISRVLLPQGKFVIFTSTPEQMQTYWLNHYFSIMFEHSIQQMPSVDKIEAALRHAHLTLLEIKPFNVSEELKDLFLFSGKQRPEMYLSESVRTGISSFRNFCPSAELESGLSLLSGDIKSGNIHSIIEKYEQTKGDYCFLVAQK
ncbi:MAG TPA: class I SAM-dependent methyltransferase [Cellvibrio sp.]|nr:class I SAM-dependent methyltransferase [Cellvibrio sp.]